MEIFNESVRALDAKALPRELYKWLQSLDLSYSVTNAKRDLSNGFLCAEILARYYPSEVILHSYDNGMRLETKIDNWDRVCTLLRKKGHPINKADIDPVIHCSPGAAVIFLMKLFQCLTNRNLPVPTVEPPTMPPSYMRQTASVTLKNEDINRICDKHERQVAAVSLLQAYEDNRRKQRIVDAPTLLQNARKHRPQKEHTGVTEMQAEEPLPPDEVKLKALTGAAAAGLKGKNQGESAAGQRRVDATLIASNSAVGALSRLPNLAGVAKPAVDILRPCVRDVLKQNQVELGEGDPVILLMDHCRDVRESWGGDVPGKVSDTVFARVFEELAQKADMLVDTLLKSPSEFWRMWALFFPALVEFPVESQSFEPAVYFFKHLGEVLREADASATQQLLLSVGMPSIARELAAKPAKREALCEVVYCFAQQDSPSHLMALRALKDRIPSLPDYVGCLSNFVALDAQMDLLDEHLLDVYIYYAVLALQSPQPRIRVAALSVVSAVAASGGGAQQAVLALLPNLRDLEQDDWWEVQAQLLVVFSHMLRGIADEEKLSSEQSHAAEKEQLLSLVHSIFNYRGASKHVIQVGLSSLARNLGDYPELLPTYMDLLLAQPPGLRRRLLGLEQREEEGWKVAYVMGTSSRVFDEARIGKFWPSLEVAKTFALMINNARRAGVERFETEHLEVLLAALPPSFEEEYADEWIRVFDDVKELLFVALFDVELHGGAREVVFRFWMTPVERIAEGSVAASKSTFVEALNGLLYGPKAQVGVCTSEDDMLDFLKVLKDNGGQAAKGVAEVISDFQQKNPGKGPRLAQL